MNAETDSLRKALRISFKSARKFIALARTAATPTLKAEFVKMAMACRQNCAKYRASLRGAS
jgi:hypothetical protein